ncbi:DUF2141 domain-containing protein [Robiginitalea sp. SC105]|uniref:DUF2141 domain-containing protein n=1 Tax=Robiginitalea sp. SC105 TaxID=2762332 RepID=UPI00163AEA29|nr:DUF2141 domain-containing protein [Robiginitalea sp. SC105]MBC2838436.1 DUF2141 domain-containing protein [Robiginitalea sp. SC105]
MKEKIWLLACLFPLSLLGQNRLQIDVEGVEASEGEIQVAVYNQAENFLTIEGVYRSDSTKASKGTTRVFLEDLPSGRYALAIFHDRNSNRELDTNWIGIPKEPMGFSNSRMKTFGPPSFRDCELFLESDSHIVIRLE